MLTKPPRSAWSRASSPTSDLLSEALDLADQINGWSTQGAALTKRTMWAGLEMSSLRGAIEIESHTQLFVRLTTKNFEEAVRAAKKGAAQTSRTDHSSRIHSAAP